jgi:hypothetical protein
MSSSSGSQKRKIAAESANRHAQFMKKVPKLSSFFRGNDATATPEGDRTESTDNGSTETASSSGAAGTFATAYTEKTTIVLCKTFYIT